MGQNVIFVGTAGWSVPRIFSESFPTDGRQLERYAAVFGAAEINTSFYRPHRRSTYERWAASVPEAFRFSVKAPKVVSHGDWATLAVPLDAFFEEIAGLGDRLGPILVQLPPKRAFSCDEAERILSAFRSRTDRPIVLEPRHASWFDPAADDVLRAWRIARVAADPPRAAGADRPAGWPGIAYLRLHGSPVVYRSSYEGDRLAALSIEVRRAMQAGSQVWCIFDNTASYAATGDALSLVRLLGETTGHDLRHETS